MKKNRSFLGSGKAFAAILSAGIGSFLGLFVFLANKRFQSGKKMDRQHKSGPTLKNGKALAAILSAGVGSLILGLITLIGHVNEAAEELLIFYPPTGPLSGISTLAIIGWLVFWTVFYFAWRNYDVNFNRVFVITLILIGLGLLFMFPPFFKII